MLLGLHCGGDPGDAAPDPAAVPDPDLSEMEPQVAEALAQSRQVLLAQRESAELWGDLGGLYDAHGLLDLAEVCYRRAVELEPDEFRWTYLLAIAREIAGAEIDEVQSLFGRAAELRPDYAQIDLRLGDAFSRRGEYARAREHFERAVAADPTTAVAQRGLGQVLLSLDDAAAAIDPLTQATMLEPRDRTAVSSLAQAYMRLGDVEAAERLVVTAERLEPVNSIDDPVWGAAVYDRSLSSSRVFRRGRAKLRDADDRGAAEDFETVLRALPEEASAHFWLATAYRNLGDRDRSLRHFARAAELRPRMVKAHVAAGELAYALERYEESESHFRAAIEVTPSDGGLYLALAEVLMRREDLEGLVAAYDSAAQFKPLGARQETNLGVALMRLDQPASAVEHFDRSLEARPNDPNTLYNLGLAYEMLGREAEAIESFRTAATLDPSHAAARHLVESHESNGN
jgi:tetratricopeptide (TPR) repeat protein